MPEPIRRILDRILEFWRNLNNRQRIIIVSVVAVVVIAIAILAFVLTRPTMVTLVEAGSAQEATSIGELLDGENISYTVSDDGLIYSVNKNDYGTASILLGTNGIPSAGFSIDDALTGSFSTTEADKQKRYKLYLENKFAENLESINSVESAKVILSIPAEDGTLSSRQQESFASVTLTLSGDLSDDQAAGIASYIATGLGNESTKNITIVSSTGDVLYRGGDEATAAGQASSNQSYQQKAEANISNKVKSVVLGSGVYDDVEVSPHLDLNFNQQEIVDYHYYVDEGQTQGYLDYRREATTDSTSGAGGTPGTDTNDDDTTYVMEDGNVVTSNTSDVEEDYLPSETITRTTTSIGTLNTEASSISVVATNTVIYNEDQLEASGQLDDMTFDEFIQQNSERTTMEVDDSFIEMVSRATGIAEGNISFVAYQVPMFQYSDGSGRDWTDYLQIVLAILIFAMLAFVVLRTLRPEKEEEIAEEITVESLLESEEESLEDIDYTDKSETRLMIEKFVDDNPEAAASLLRNWLNSDWG